MRDSRVWTMNHRLSSNLQRMVKNLSTPPQPQLFLCWQTTVYYHKHFWAFNKHDRTKEKSAANKYKFVVQSHVRDEVLVKRWNIKNRSCSYVKSFFLYIFSYVQWLEKKRRPATHCAIVYASLCGFFSYIFSPWT